MTLRRPGSPRSSRPPRRRVLAAVSALAVVASMMAVSLTGAASAAPGDDPSTRAGSTFGAESARQVAALQRIKASASKAEAKLDSRLLLTLRQRTNARALTAAPKLRLGVAVSGSGATVVDVRSTGATNDLRGRLKAAGATVTGVWDDTVRATVPVSALPTVASWSDVLHVAPPVGAETQRASASQSGSVHAADTARQSTIDSAVASIRQRTDRDVRVGQGAIVSEGDQADAAAQARRKYRVTGTGVKVCVLSDGVDSLAGSQAAGELPDVDMLPGQEGSGDEGTAMLEIVHDLAPNATLGFATAFTSEQSFAQNIRDLRSVGDCDVIVDDVIYYAESPFQDGPVAQAVDAVHADGAVYLSSAGNQGNLLSGTSGTWEGAFADSGRGVGKFAGTAHDFDPGAGVQVFDPLSPNSAGAVTPLFWAEPSGAAASDYDMYVFDSSGAVVALSQDVQDGDDDPFEILQIPNGSDYKLAVVKFSGAARYFQVTAFGGRFQANSGLTAFATSGAQRGHATAEGAISVAAAPADEPLPFLLEPGDPPNPSGPFPKAFGSKQVPEPFTSDGPRRIFFETDGSEITPGDTSSTGGEVRAKPDVLAADGVRTSVDGFDPFFGTSAAAPHAAAIAALVLSGKPGPTPATTPDAIASAMKATAIDLKPLGFDPRSGPGALRADRLLQYTGAVPQPRLTAGDLSATDSATAPGGDGDGFLEPGETGVLTVPVTNTGDGRADRVVVSLATSAPGVTLSPASRGYGAILPGASTTRTFTVRLSEDCPNGRPLPIAVTVSAANAAASTATRTLSVGRPSSTPTVVSYDGPAVPIPDDDPGGVSVPLEVSGVGYASDVRFSVDGSDCTADAGSTTVGIDHTYVGDLSGTLTAPNGTTARLFARAGGGGNNLCQVVFDDGATTPFAGVDSVSAPFTGTYLPIDPLGALLSDPVDGTWTFTVSDQAAADTGNVRAFSLRFTSVDAP